MKKILYSLLIFSALTSTGKTVAHPKIEYVEYKGELVRKPYVAYLDSGGRVEVWREGNKYCCTHYPSAGPLPIASELVHYGVYLAQAAQEEFELIEKEFNAQDTDPTLRPATDLQ